MSKHVFNLYLYRDLINYKLVTGESDTPPNISVSFRVEIDDDTVTAITRTRTGAAPETKMTTEGDESGLFLTVGLKWTDAMAHGPGARGLMKALHKAYPPELRDLT